jgi:hypothetical protein
LGDETPLSELLRPYQHSDFCPLINELLDLKRRLDKDGATRAQIRDAVLARLNEAGLEIGEKDRDRLLRFVAPVGLLGLLVTPVAVVAQFANTGVEALAQLSAAQLGFFGLAAVSGAVVCSIADRMTGQGSFRIAGIEYPRTIVSNAARSDISVRLEGTPAFPVEMIFRPRSCPEGFTCNTLRAQFQSAPDDSLLRGQGWLYCHGEFQQVWNMDWELVLRDSTGVEVSRPTPVRCQPR